MCQNRHDVNGSSGIGVGSFLSRLPTSSHNPPLLLGLHLCLLCCLRSCHLLLVVYGPPACYITIVSVLKINTCIALLAMSVAMGVPEQHDVRLRAVNCIVHPATALLDANLSPLVLQHQGSPVNLKPPHHCMTVTGHTLMWTRTRLRQQHALTQQLRYVLWQDYVPVSHKGKTNSQDGLLSVMAWHSKVIPVIGKATSGILESNDACVSAQVEPHSVERSSPTNLYSYTSS